MLRELVKRWANHKIMVRWLSRFFYYLDRYFIARRSLPPLNEVGLTCFRDLVSHDSVLSPESNHFALRYVIFLVFINSPPSFFLILLASKCTLLFPSPLFNKNQTVISWAHIFSFSGLPGIECKS